MCQCRQLFYSRNQQTPVQPKFLSLDADGLSLPSDWYLRLSGYGTSVLRGKEKLQAKLPIDADE